MFSECLSKTEAVDRIRLCLQKGSIRPSFHFREELANEGLTEQDAYKVLKYGRIYDEAEQEMKSGEYKYRIEGHEPGGKWLVIVFCFKSIDMALLITVFSVASKERRS